MIAVGVRAHWRCAVSWRSRLGGLVCWKTRYLTLGRESLLVLVWVWKVVLVGVVEVMVVKRALVATTFHVWDFF